MHRGRLIRCDSPGALRTSLTEELLRGPGDGSPRRARTAARRRGRRQRRARRATCCTCFWLPRAPRAERLERARPRRVPAHRAVARRRLHRPDPQGGGRMNGNGVAVEVRELVKRFGDFVAVDHVSLSRRPRRDLRLPGSQRRGQVHHHPHALRPARAPPAAAPRWAASTWPRSRSRSSATSATCRRSSRSTTTYGGGEHRLLRRRLRRSPPDARARAQGVRRCKHGGPGRPARDR